MNPAAWPLLIVAAGLGAGCASPQTNGYLDLGMGVRSDELSDVILRQESGFECDRLTAEVALGIEHEFDNGNSAYCELYHWSHLLCGGPFGEGKPELYELRGRCLGRIRF